MPNIIDQVASDFPQLKIVIGHGGWPWVAGICCVACNHLNVYISPDLYGINSPGYQDYITAANFRLQDKIIFGSAYPCVPLKDAVEFYSNCGIKKSVLPKIMYYNAATLLEIE